MHKRSSSDGDPENLQDKAPQKQSESISEPAKEVKLTIVVCNGDSDPAHETAESAQKVDSSKKVCLMSCEEQQKQNESISEEVKVTIVDCNGDSSQETTELAQKITFSRNVSCHEQCRVCQQEKEEALIELGCECRGGLAKAHRSCIDAWFYTKGSNQCEICQVVAVNVQAPETQPTTNYWIWRIDPSYRQQEHQRECFNPLWVAFSILIGGLMLDLLISITLGFSALPANIIVGVIVVLGLGTALRLTLEFCYEWRLRRAVHRAESNFTHTYPPAL